ncbi:signal protein [Comamonas sediminis]|uniref:signal protein n=1 Tax=Comamonas sediminis TaxID=1783360 RepID=UPI003D2BE49E
MRNTWKAWISGIALCGTAAVFAQTPAAGTAPAAKPAPAAKAAPAAPAAAAAAPAAAADKTKTNTPAPGGGAGKVWANTNSKIYHCQGDRHYGTTKQGEYMTLADAKAKGIQPAKGSKACNS